MVVYTFNSSTQDTKASRSLWIQGQPDLQFQACPGFHSETLPKNESEIKK